MSAFSKAFSRCSVPDFFFFLAAATAPTLPGIFCKERNTHFLQKNKHTFPAKKKHTFSAKKETHNPKTLVYLSHPKTHGHTIKTMRNKDTPSDEHKDTLILTTMEVQSTDLIESRFSAVIL